MADGDEGSAFRFHGNWREFAPIAFTNLLLIIVTLGIYRFWAKTRERRYLWSRTDFIGDPLEWTGTGKELFVGFILAVLIFGVPLVLIQFGVQALIMRGQLGLAQLGGLIFTMALLYLVGVARFRALRYRLSRTFWHGIRGGSNDNGLGYGWSYVWKTLVGGLVLFLMMPWAMIDLWNQRWSSMSFGSHDFQACAEHGPLVKRLLLCYAIVVAAVGSLLLAYSASPSAFALLLLIVVFLILLLFPFYYVLFLRLAIGGLSLHRIDFRFTARTIDLVKLLLGDVVLVVFTLGLGFVFLGYRHWTFFIRHMEAGGEIVLAELTQSTTDAPRQGEGLLDAFDVGAF